MAVRFMNPFQRSDVLMALTSPLEFLKARKQIKLMHDFTDRVIAERKLQLEKSLGNGIQEIQD